jgi:MFS family permease
MIFSIAQMLMGAGTTPLYSLGPAYIDENVHPKASPIYLGVWFATTIMGPGLGFIVGGSILSIYVDINLVSLCVLLYASLITFAALLSSLYILGSL